MGFKRLNLKTKSYAFLFVLLFMAIILAASIWTYFQYSYIADVESQDLLSGVKKPEYHFVVIAQNTDDPFWQSVSKGVFEAAKQYNVAVEFNGPRFTNLTEELQYLEIAIASKVDGIVTHVLDETSFSAAINKAVSANIPVITIESDAEKSQRIAYVGTNNFRLGAEGGKLVSEASGSKANVGILLNSFNPDNGNASQNQMIYGFKDAVKDKSVVVKTIRSSSMGTLSAGEVTSKIINDNPDINAIFCTSARDTVGAAQVVVDLNRVGEIKIIGYGDLPEILRYIEKGVIYGTIVSNPVEMGHESIKALYEIKKNNKTSSYVDTGLNVITNDNLAEYRKLNPDQEGIDE